MRLTIAHEGTEVVPRQFLEIGSLKWGCKRIPVTGPGSHSVPIGMAQRLRHEDDGSITAEVEFFDEKRADVETLLNHNDIGATVFCNEVVSKHKGAKMIVKSAKIKTIFLDLGIVELRRKAGFA
jgi:hypothetical protein